MCVSFQKAFLVTLFHKKAGQKLYNGFALCPSNPKLQKCWFQMSLLNSVGGVSSVGGVGSVGT